MITMDVFQVKAIADDLPFDLIYTGDYTDDPYAARPKTCFAVTLTDPDQIYQVEKAMEGVLGDTRTYLAFVGVRPDLAYTPGRYTIAFPNLTLTA